MGQTATISENFNQETSSYLLKDIPLQESSTVLAPAKYKIVLDIGCGGTPRGHVNIDAYPDNREQCSKPWDPRNVRNFIRADAHSLPLRSDAFTNIVCSHVIEHTFNPLQMLTEMKRVCKGPIEILTPSEFDVGKTATHYYTWNPHTMKNLMCLVFDDVETGYLNRTLIMHTKRKLVRFFPFLNDVLSKMGIYTEIYACAQRRVNISRKKNV